LPLMWGNASRPSVAGGESILIVPWTLWALRGCAIAPSLP
jgi:hypothetical protein